MGRTILMLVLTFALLLVSLSCARRYHPPPQPQPIDPNQALAQLAERHGFTTGRADGARDAENGAPFRPRHTRAFHDTPGHDTTLGAFHLYRDAYREAYLRGYQRGFAPH